MNQPVTCFSDLTAKYDLIRGIAVTSPIRDISVVLIKSRRGSIIISLCPSGSYPIPKMIIGVTEMIVIMTMEANTNRVIVENDKKLIKPLDFILKAHVFFN